MVMDVTVSETFRFKARAKLNISLKVLGKRKDGFHDLETVMVPIQGLRDELVFKRGEEGSGFNLSCEAEGVPVDESNLVTKAVRELVKSVPHGAGMGGGSGDAAVALRALNYLEEAGLSTDEMVEMATELGSDVPFFLFDCSCICRGRGELIEPLDVLVMGERVLLVKPAFGVSTPDAYKRWKKSKELLGVNYAPQKFSWGELVNDLERPVFEKHLVLAEMKEWLRRQEGVRGALMSGSGSTMFAVLDDKVDSYVLQESLRERFGDSLWMKEVSI